jgi:hypothetical protein
LHLCQEQLRNVRVSQFSSCFSWDDWFCESYTSHTTVGSAKKFVRITSCFGGGEFTKTLRKVCTCQKFKFSFLLLEHCKIRECYAVANAFAIRNMHSLFLYMKCNLKYYFYTYKNPTGRRASVQELITRQTCKICDYTVDYMCRTKTSKSPHAFAMCSIRTDLLKQENEKIDSL